MVREKKFYLKVRKAGVRWGCGCCIPVGRDAKKRRTRVFVKMLCSIGKRKEDSLLKEIYEDLDT